MKSPLSRKLDQIRFDKEVLRVAYLVVFLAVLTFAYGPALLAVILLVVAAILVWLSYEAAKAPYVN
jgi:hypothetical protein